VSASEKKKPTKPTKSKEKKKAEEEVIEHQQPPVIMVVPGGGKEDDKVRCVGLIGDITEEKASETMYGMLALRQSGLVESLVDEDEPDGEIKTEQLPFELIISTHGGNASDMFAIYDLMRDTMDTGTEVHTFALGKVMSAGVLLLAAGTKGKRRIGKHCRVMIHGVSSGYGGQIQDHENELEEFKEIQQLYIKALEQETAMSKKYLKNLMGKKLNVYIDAEEALELGIADTIV
jgi:ATP-dependent Clp endopeptidase proteolytic subunit ClpP